MTVRRSRSLFKEVPLQYSCLENPMDRWAWWAAAYGVAQSWTQLKRLSSSTLRVLCEYQLGECLLSRFSHVRLFVTPRTVAHRAPLSVGFSRQEYWNRLLCPPPGDLPDPGIKPAFLMTLGLAGQFFTTSATWEALLKASVQFSSVQLLNRVQLFVTPWTAAHQASLSIASSQSWYTQKHYQ